MASPTSTFATLRALHLVIADALDDIQRVFSQRDPPASPASRSSSPIYPSSPFPTTPPASFPPTPLSATFPSPPQSDMAIPFMDYPSPDLPLVSDSPCEQLALHPDAVAAATRIVAACGQLSNIVHKPFLSLCDAIMTYNLPACMRLVEHLHVAEILREAEEKRQRCLPRYPVPGSLELNLGASGPASNTLAREAVDIQTVVSSLDSMPGSHTHKATEGLHVADIANVICSYAGINYVDPNELVHALRLLSTHHIFRETAPDTFALNRVASLLDSGKSVNDVFLDPEAKYDDTGGIPAFIALRRLLTTSFLVTSTDELFKSAAYLTEAFTGVQLPATPSSSLPDDAVLPGITAIPSTSSYVANNPATFPSTRRSSSILTHIQYPEDGDVQHLSPDMPVPLRPPVAEPLSSLPPFLSPVEPLSQTAECTHSRNLAKPDKVLAFNLAFRTSVPYFEWLENGGKDPLGGTGKGASIHNTLPTKVERVLRDETQSSEPSNVPNSTSRKPHRLQRFSNAMVGSIGWEAPRAILSGFDWYSLRKGSTIIDVGGGIGSTTMFLARALNDPRLDPVKKEDGVHNEGEQPTLTTIPRHKLKLPSDASLVAGDEPQSNNGLNLRFIIQDRPVVTPLGIEAWRFKCPEMLESGQVVFQNQDFFEPQLPLEPPHLTRHPSVYLLRVVLHDWPDEAARRILINLRVASNPETRLVIAEHVLPLACVDEDVFDHVKTEVYEGRSTEQWTISSVLANIEGAERTLAAPPLLSNLGKASANAYWMDLIMHISLNGKERTLREFCSLALSAGWRITRMTRPEGLLFAYLVCEPITLPDDAQAIYNAVVLSSELSAVVTVPSDELAHHSAMEPSRLKPLPAMPVSLLPSPILVRSSSRCGTPTFGSRTLLPKDEDILNPRSRGAGATKKWFKSKGLGVRGVMMQKVEKQREEQSLTKGSSTRDSSNVQSGPASSSHGRVWWKKTPPGSVSHSTTAVHELNGDVPEHCATGRGRRGTTKSSDVPSTPSPRISPVHQQWPSTDSSALPLSEVSPPVPRARRPSVASITRKLSFATFNRRPSVPDIAEPLPTPPSGTTLTDLAPPANLRGDTGRSLQHLPNLPTFERGELTTGTITTAMVRPTIPRRPSPGHIGQTSAVVQPILSKSALTRRLDVGGSPKSGILKSSASPQASKQSQSLPDAASMAESSTSGPRRQRRVTLSNSPGILPRNLVKGSHASSIANGVGPDSNHAPEVRRVPSVPKLPRRLSIPMLRRKQSQTVVRDDGKG